MRAGLGAAPRPAGPSPRAVDASSAAVPTTSRLVKFHAPEIVFGPGSLAEAGFAARRLGARRPFVVTDPGVIEAGWADELLGAPARGRAAPRRVARRHAQPEGPRGRRGARPLPRGRGCDVLIALGGGSCIDAAKGIAILSTNGGHDPGLRRRRPGVAPDPPAADDPDAPPAPAPTSRSSASSPTRPGAVKVTIMGAALVPDISLIDPRLLSTMPEWLTAATGLDALTHGIESYVSLAHNPLADIHAPQRGGARRPAPAPDDPAARGPGGPRGDGAGQPRRGPGLHQRHPRRHPRDEPPGRRSARRRRTASSTASCCRTSSATTPGPRRSASWRWRARSGCPSTGCPATRRPSCSPSTCAVSPTTSGCRGGCASSGSTSPCSASWRTTTLDDACLTTNPRTASSEELVRLFQDAL